MPWGIVAIALVLAGCGADALDACARFAGDSCLVVRARGRNPVEQLELTALGGFVFAPNPARTPPSAGEAFALPALVPIDLGNFAGEFRLRVAGLRGGQVRALDEIEDTIGRGERKLVEAQLVRVDSDAGALDLAAPLPDLASDGGEECSVDCGVLPGVDPAAVRCAGARCEVSNACLTGRGHCSALWEDGCESDFTTALTCGSCTLTCNGATPLCSTASCVSSCAGATPGQCGSTCVSFESPSTCGGCDLRCEAPFAAIATCDGGRCGWECAPDARRVGDKCLQWEAQTSGVTDNLYAVFGFGTGSLYAGGETGRLLHSTGNGAWDLPSFPDTSGDLNAIWGRSDTDLFAADSAGYIHHRLVGGWITDAVISEPFWAMSGNASGAWAASQTSIFSFNGDMWLPSHADVEAQLSGLWAGPSQVWAVGARRISQPLTTFYRGHLLIGPGTWTAYSTGANRHNAVWGAGDHVYAAAAVGVIYHFYNGGYTRQETGVISDLNGIFGTGADDIYAVGDDGVIFHSTGIGTWTRQDSGTTQRLNAVWATSGPSGRVVYVVGDAGLILRKL